jgi:hypothetical protein
VAALSVGGPAGAAEAGPVDLSVPPSTRPVPAEVGTPWTDPTGADHRARDAERRARERAPVPPAALPPPAAPAKADPVPGPDPATLEEIRRRGERERDARQRRGSIAPPPPPTPRIAPDPPSAVPTPPAPPRIAIPGPGEPGGPPIPLPSCGPAGCFDANGRPMPRVGGTDVLIGPGGRPCVQVGGAASC